MAREITESWDRNAAAWVYAVQGDKIASRAAGTNDAILQTVRAQSPRRILDVGCGEGWLTRALTRLGYEAVGIDGSRELITTAKTFAEGTFYHATFRDLEAGYLPPGSPFDMAVCNFSLFEEDLHPLLRALGDAVRPGGHLVIQTLHPAGLLNAAEGYRSCWMREAFASLGAEFTASMPYFHRTFAGWVGLLRRSGWHISACEEPVHPESGAPLSLVLAAERTQAP